MQIQVNGLSSKTSRKYKISDNEKTMKLLKFLQSKNLPIASSCRGEGICKFCKTQEGILTCKITVENFHANHGQEINISYL